MPSVPANVVLRDAHNIGHALAFDKSAEKLATGGTEGQIRIWRLPAGNEIGGWRATNGAVQGLHFLNRNREILTAAYDGTLARWSHDGKLIKRVIAVSPIIDWAVDESSDTIVTGHHDGQVRMWRITDFSMTRQRALHRGKVLAVAYHSATGQMASSGTDNRVYYWLHDDEPRPLPAPPTEAKDLAFSPDGHLLMGSGWFRLFRWRMPDGAFSILPTAHRGIVKSIAFSSDSRMIASIGRQTDSAVYLLNAQSGVVLRRFQPHELCGTYVRLSPNGRYLASTGDDGRVQLWDLQHPLPEQKYYSENH